MRIYRAYFEPHSFILSNKYLYSKFDEQHFFQQKKIDIKFSEEQVIDRTKNNLLIEGKNGIRWLKPNMFIPFPLWAKTKDDAVQMLRWQYLVDDLIKRPSSYFGSDLNKKLWIEASKLREDLCIKWLKENNIFSLIDPPWDKNSNNKRKIWIS